MTKPLLSQINQLQDADALTLIQNIQQHPIPLQGSVSVSTAYVQQGQGNPPIVLLHGFDSSLLEFRYLLPLLAARHQTWAVDCFGFGFTEHLKELPVNPALIRQHLHRFWQTLIQTPIVLVGASLGGAIAMDFTLAYPECVTRLVLIDSVGFSGSFPVGQFIFPPFDSLATGWLRLRKWAALTALAASPNPDRKLIDAVRCSLLHHDTPGWSEATISFTKSGGYFDLSSRIARIQQPILVLWGDSDDVLGTGDAEKFKSAIVNSRLIWINQCGHNPHLEKPETTAEHILDFVQP